MTMLKLLGAALILAAGAGAAVLALRFERRRIAALAGWIDLISYIRARVDCCLLPLPQILERADAALPQACFCKEPHPDLFAIYRSSQPYLDAEAKRLLSSFLHAISCLTREEVLRQSDACVAALEGLRKKRLEELVAKTRVSVAVCLGSAALIAILLW